MAINATCNARVSGISCFRLCTAQAQQLADFYQSALDFRLVSIEKLSDAQTRALTGIGGRALHILLTLGAQRVELIQFIDRPGRPYPAGSKASDLIFQHFALVVRHMTAAMQRLTEQRDWTPISFDGPQRLPASSGGVTAFKFRDPEGHPLELLAFPEREMPSHWKHVANDVRRNSLFLGIDHTAISVSDSARTIAFYDSLGLAVSNRSVNDDPAQSRLDQLDNPVVDVVAMVADQTTPHLELLCYRNSLKNDSLDLQANDVAATCLVFESEQSPKPDGSQRKSPRIQTDPDGHLVAMAPPVS